MKQFFPRSLLRRLAALALAAALALPTAYASAGETKLQTNQTITDGLTYTNTISLHPESGRTESFALELGTDSPVYPMMIQGSDTMYSGASINKAVEHAREKGYHVLAGINTDFFSYATGVPMGIVIEDGIYKCSPEGQTALTVTDGKFDLMDPPEVIITLTNEETDSQVSLTHLNKWRVGTGGLYLLNEHFSTVSTRTSTSGWMVRLEEVDKEDELTVSGEITLEVTELILGSDAVPIGEDNYILTADALSNLMHVYESFQVGDRVTLTTQCDTPQLEEVQWACGAGDVMIRDGELTDPEVWAYTEKGRDPRTALGMRDDGTVVFYVVDGRKAGYSAGLSQLDLANELLEQGCQWAVNLDGGGSSAMSIWVPGTEGTAIVNNPSDGKPRACATYLLLVTDDAGSGQPDRLALAEDGLVVLAGSSVDLGQAVVLDSGLNVLEETVSDLSIRSREDLGTIDGTVYTAGSIPGTDTLTLMSKDLGVKGTAQIHVVDALTELTLSLANSDTILTSLALKPGDQVALSAQGTYFSRPALREKGETIWTAEGGAGTIDENGIFTAALDGTLAGTITASSGSLTATIPVELTNIHLDVPEGHWAYEAVDYCYTHKLVSGISSSQFGPDANIRRGDFLLMLYRAAGSPQVTTTVDFPDVAPTDYYATAIAWAQEYGLASGMADGTFSPNTNITREQAFTILNRALPLVGIECDYVPVVVLERFKDLSNLSNWAAEHAAVLAAYHFIGGEDNMLNPKVNLTRIEMAVLLYKMGTYDPETVIPDIPEMDPSIPLGVIMGQEAVTLTAGESIPLTASLYPETAQGDIHWTISSSVANAACISADGIITNLNTTGQTVNLTVNASCGVLYKSCTVHCLPAEHSGKVVDDAVLNVRSGPGTDHAVLDHISSGMGVIVLEHLDNNWLHVQYLSSSGAAASGYVSADYIILDP